MDGQLAREWFRKSPDMWSRIEGGEWAKSRVGLPSITFPGNYSLIIAYNGSTVKVRRSGSGPVTYGLSTGPGGSMEFEADGPGGIVRRITRFNQMGQREWEEQRSQEMREGKAVLLSRVRRTFLPQHGETRESCTWQTGTNSVSIQEMTPPQ